MDCVVCISVNILAHDIVIDYCTEEIDVIINGISGVSKGSGVGELDSDNVPFWDLPKTLKRKQWKDDDIEAVNTGGAHYAAMKRSNFD